MKHLRRAFVKNGMLVVSAGMMMPGIFSRALASQRELQLVGERSTLAATNRTLIVVQMAGGNDGLNTIVPFTDSAYYEMRPTLAVPLDQVLQLDNRLGLHPALGPLKPFWDNSNLAIVEGVGYPNQSLSHFEAMDIWQTLDLQGTGREGWLGKLVAGWVDQDGHPFKAINIGSQTATALRSLQTSVPTLTSPDSYQIRSDPAESGKTRLQALMKLYSTYPHSAPYAALLDTMALEASVGSQQLKNAVSQYQSTIQYPNGPFAAGLKVLAGAIIEDLGLRIGYVTLGGFDTHSGQKTAHENLLKTLADGLSAFFADLQEHGKADQVVVMTWSEFGRRVEENGSLGTDHGTAAPLFVLGASVSGGIYGEPPALNNLDDAGNLKYTIDFRSVYATVLDRWIGASSKDVLGSSFDAHNFLPRL